MSGVENTGSPKDRVKALCGAVLGKKISSPCGIPALSGTSHEGFHAAGLFYPLEPSTLVTMRCIETPHFVRGLVAILQYPQEHLSLCSLRL